MTLTELHWVEGPWPGKLALTARPRGGDWLEDEIAGWRSAGVDTVVSLLEEDEELDLDLGEERNAFQAQSMRFKPLPIADRRVPLSEVEFSKRIDELDRELAAGKNVVVHSRQGIGRTGLVAGCLLVLRGLEPEAAVRRLSEARGAAVPETAEQRRWIDHYAEMLSTTR